MCPRIEGQAAQQRTSLKAPAEHRAMECAVAALDDGVVIFTSSEGLIDNLRGKLSTRQGEENAAAGEGINERARIADGKHAGHRWLMAIRDRPGAEPFAINRGVAQPRARRWIGEQRRCKQCLPITFRRAQCFFGGDKTKIGTTAFNIGEAAVAIAEEKQLTGFAQSFNAAQMDFASEEARVSEARSSRGEEVIAARSVNHQATRERSTV